MFSLTRNTVSLARGREPHMRVSRKWSTEARRQPHSTGSSLRAARPCRRCEASNRCDRAPIRIIKWRVRSTTDRTMNHSMTCARPPATRPKQDDAEHNHQARRAEPRGCRRHADYLPVIPTCCTWSTMAGRRPAARGATSARYLVPTRPRTSGHRAQSWADCAGGPRRPGPLATTTWQSAASSACCRRPRRRCPRRRSRGLRPLHRR
mmetsp:Transcript_330/g.1476  ORF Transcript_330/g.1476 Transcript_330/m.1476 type:complete len:207 (-) Transcript_330:67-687(-)